MRLSLIQQFVLVLSLILGTESYGRIWRCEGHCSGETSSDQWYSFHLGQGHNPWKYDSHWDREICNSKKYTYAFETVCRKNRDSSHDCRMRCSNSSQGDIRSETGISCESESDAANNFFQKCDPWQKSKIKYCI